MFGNLVLLKRWHWLVLSLLIGAAVGYVMQPPSLGLADYGQEVNGPKDYLRNLVRETEGRRRFMDLTVHRQWVTDPAGGSREAWIVSGLYCGNASDPSDGAWHWKPRFFRA